MTIFDFDLLRPAKPANRDELEPGARADVATASSVAFNFTYDGTNRRVSQTVNDNSWWSVPSSAASTSYTANNLDQYSAVSSFAPTYDTNGNLTCDGSYQYSYDFASRLTGISKLGTSGNCASSTTTVAAYVYDAQGRRRAKP